MSDKILEAGFDHPCRQTCSGWEQGRQRGTFDANDHHSKFQRDKLEQAGLAEEFDLHGCDAVEWMADEIVSLRIIAESHRAMSAKLAAALIEAIDFSVIPYGPDSVAINVINEYNKERGECICGETNARNCPVHQ